MLNLARWEPALQDGAGNNEAPARPFFQRIAPGLAAESEAVIGSGVSRNRREGRRIGYAALDGRRSRKLPIAGRRGVAGGGQ